MEVLEVKAGLLPHGRVIPEGCGLTRGLVEEVDKVFQKTSFGVLLLIWVRGVGAC
jgi:hypothetical protein